MSKEKRSGGGGLGWEKHWERGVGRGEAENVPRGPAEVGEEAGLGCRRHPGELPGTLFKGSSQTAEMAPE